jgi:nucleoside-triphosphatase
MVPPRTRFARSQGNGFAADRNISNVSLGRPGGDRIAPVEKRAMSATRKSKPHVLLITGVPGVGKTTVIRRVADGLDHKRLRGFCTEEIREDDERRGFRLVGFDGMAQVFAHVNFPKRHRVGKYGVDVAVLDNAASLLRPDPDASVYLVDEIGKMECLSERFIAAMRALLSGHTPIVATVGAYGGGFIAEVKHRPECELWEVTHVNRDNLPARILAWLAERS